MLHLYLKHATYDHRMQAKKRITPNPVGGALERFIFFSTFAPSKDTPRWIL